ncbi:asparagine synthase (glutamine-hydrolyzing) [Pedobacter xixiisoli]|uniref:asparagine synthase (glutamine-hydrolyzing) n=1 Tax=Pedobacter xixiisoli TaxID=1476464 RepID=A0A285ZPY4_9SPHI|nr:asparagine synthase (glutamine-hydrolyzing) [Pedobacter xixiisoli]SOD11704.1 asparagine synthase (glutamine-hydrolysing) [Pedobacter xixiisoli]
MCGITGFIDYQQSISEQNLLNASTALRHRGGNGNGHIYEPHERYNVGLANERLATIDRSNNGLQPFTSACGNYTITFNGTIYNYLELRATLIKYGITFNTLSDTEVLIECYKKWGHQLFEKIDGAFAFAILDRKQKQLFLARDTMGVKPLYFFKDKNFFAFASELKGMLCYPIVKQTNTRALAGYLRKGYFEGNETIFENIFSFKKQHYFIIDLNSGNFLESKFENATLLHKPTNSEAEITEKVHELLTESVLRRNVADVNIGVMLSGGYDSATVAAILQKNQAKKLRTFTLGFKDKTLDEAPAANAIAKHLNTNHSEYYIDDAGAINMLEKMPDIFDEPMGDSGAVPLAFLVSQIAKEDISVLLGAEGGDELFAGYTNYKRAIWLHQKSKQLPNFIKKLAIGLSKDRKNKLKEILFAESLTGVYESLASFYPANEISKLLNKEVKISLTNNSSDSIKSLLIFDQENYLPNDLLLKSDRITMHYGIDNRDAMLKTDLVDLLKTIEDKWFIKDGNLKYLLKNITHQYIPKKLMDRPKKGFSIPIVEWMSTIYRPYLEQYLSPEQLDKHRFFDIVEVFKIKNRFYMNPNGGDARKLWLLLQFQMWYNQHFS